MSKLRFVLLSVLVVACSSDDGTPGNGGTPANGVDGTWLVTELSCDSQKIPVGEFTLDVNGGVQATLNVTTKDTDAANNLRQVINGFMALARMQAGPNANRPEMAAMLQSIQLGGDGKTVSVSFTLPVEALDLLKAGPKKLE